MTARDCPTPAEVRAEKLHDWATGLPGEAAVRSLRIVGTWLVEDVDEHTCGTGGWAGPCEPFCGLEPLVDLSTLPGWNEVTR